MTPRESKSTMMIIIGLLMVSSCVAMLLLWCDFMNAEAEDGRTLHRY